MSRGSVKRIAATTCILTVAFLLLGRAQAGSSQAVPTASSRPQAPALPAQTASLEGTSWQLLQFKGGDDATLIPDDGSRYTIEFAPEGQLYARVDCNRGRGTWKTNGANELELGPLALTRVKCVKGSLHDHIVERWENIRSYKLENDRLSLSLAGGAGVYEFEPIRRSRATSVPETEFRGIVSAVTGVCPVLRLTVSGTSVATNGSTHFDSGCSALRVGSVVHVQGSRAADASIVALRIAAGEDLRREGSEFAGRQ